MAARETCHRPRSGASVAWYSRRGYSGQRLRWILCISIYVNSSGVNKVPFGKRAPICPGRADFEEILQVEVAGKYIKRVQDTVEERGEMPVTVSGTCELRDHLRIIVRAHLDDGVQLQEPEYQPE